MLCKVFKEKHGLPFEHYENYENIVCMKCVTWITFKNVVSNYA
jgi:hypothetical protein